MMSAVTRTVVEGSAIFRFALSKDAASHRPSAGDAVPASPILHPPGDSHDAALFFVMLTFCLPESCGLHSGPLGPVF